MHYILLLLGLIPLIYKLNFRSFVIQLKEYRNDRFFEYLSTKQGKNALINILSIFEIPAFFLTLLIYFNKGLYEGFITMLLFYILVILNIFVIGKIIRKKAFYPKRSSRLIITNTVFLFIIILLTILLAKINIDLIYSFIFLVFIFLPFLYLISIFLLKPIVDYKKNKLINKAIAISSKNNKTIKVGVTGSYGKSSVKNFLAEILSRDYKTLSSPENINTELGISDVVINKLNKKYDYFVAEMGAYCRGEISTLGDIVNHKYGFLTAIGNQHIALFGSIENTYIGKFEIAKKVMENNGTLYLNYDNKHIRKFCKPKGLKFVKYSLSEIDGAYSIIKKTKKGVKEFEFNYKNEKYLFETTLIGEHNILNLTGVLAFCFDMGLKYKKLYKYVSKLKNSTSSLSVSKVKSNTLIDDSYSLSENSLKSGIEVLNSYKTVKILVVDDILELGKIAEKQHYKLAKFISKKYKIDKILYAGVNYKEHFINGLIDGGYKEKNIINSLKGVEKSTILFEGRKSKTYMNNL